MNEQTRSRTVRSRCRPDVRAARLRSRTYGPGDARAAKRAWCACDLLPAPTHRLIGKLLLDPAVSPLDKLLLGGVGALYREPKSYSCRTSCRSSRSARRHLPRGAVVAPAPDRSGEAKVREHWDGPEDLVEFLQKVTDWRHAIYRVAVAEFRARLDRCARGCPARADERRAGVG